MIRTAVSRTTGAAPEGSIIKRVGAKALNFYRSALAPTLVCCLVLGVAASCKQKGKDFTVKGDLKEMPLTIRKVYLTTVGLDDKPILILDSAVVTNGKFELKGPKEEGLFRVMLGDPNNAP